MEDGWRSLNKPLKPGFERPEAEGNSEGHLWGQEMEKREQLHTISETTAGIQGKLSYYVFDMKTVQGSPGSN